MAGAEVATEYFFKTKPYGVDENRGAFMHAHQLVANTSNKRLQSLKHIPNVRKICPSGGSFTGIWGKCA